MPLTPFIRTEKAARKVLGNTGLFIFMWDSEWNEFAAFAKHGTPFTPQNIRGILKRTTREKGYALEILEEQMTPNPGGEQVAHEREAAAEKGEATPGRDSGNGAAICANRQNEAIAT